MTSGSERVPMGYLISASSVILAVVLTIAIEPLFHGKAPLVFFIAAAIASAAYAGSGPGLFATGFGVAIILVFFKPEILVLEVAHSSLIVFAVLGTGISLVIGRLRKTTLALAKSKEELEASHERLAKRSQSLAEANEELQRFAHGLAHDLSTPLRGISTLTELLVQRNVDVLDENSRECGAMITSRVRRMQSMIKGLLDYATAEERPGTTIAVDCNSAVASVVQELDLAIKECEARVTTDNLPSVSAAQSHVEQVFSNLIGNAIKYRPSVRRPQVHISASERGDDWVFCVADNGIGVDMQYAEEIFGMFRRLHSEDEYEGSGIGLALCKIIVQRSGGDIWVESELGKGSRFFFTLPKETPLPKN